MKLTGRDIAEIAKMLDDSHFASLDLKMGDFRLRIRRDGGGRYSARDDDDIEPGAQPPSPAPSASAAPAPVAPRAEAATGETEVPAPLLGNFYSSPRPGDPPFVNVGDTVTPDTTICIIEVMKLMNPIRAGVSGTVTAVLVEDGTAVEEGQSLIRVRTA